MLPKRKPTFDPRSLLDRFRGLGCVEGRNIAIEYQWAEGKPERMRELADELVRLEVDVIIVPGTIYTEAETSPAGETVTPQRRFRSFDFRQPVAPL